METIPPLQRPTKEARLIELLNYYRPIEVLHSTVDKMCDSPIFKEHLQKILQHDLEVIKNRSQDLDDHEISLMQKAFVTLMDEGDHVAGIELYVEEIVGLKMVEEKQKLKTLKSSVKTKDQMLTEFHAGKSPKTPYFRGLSSSRRAREQRQVSEELFVSDGSRHGNPLQRQQTTPESGVAKAQFMIDSHGDPTLKQLDEDPKFERLWNLYNTATAEFHKTPESTPLRTEAARFLRDTTENCILYIEDKTSAPNSRVYEKPKLEELRNVLKKAIVEVEKGIGFKRRFDEDWTHVPRAPKQAKTEPFKDDRPRVPSAPKEMRSERPKKIIKNPRYDGRYARDQSMKIGPPPRGSYEVPRRAPHMPLYQRPTSHHRRQRSASPGGPRHFSTNAQSREQRTSHVHRQRSASPGAPRHSLMNEQYREQRTSHVHRQRLASPGAPRHFSTDEQPRDRRRQDPWEGRWDLYRPTY